MKWAYLVWWDWDTGPTPEKYTDMAELRLRVAALRRSRERHSGCYGFGFMCIDSDGEVLL